MEERQRETALRLTETPEGAYLERGGTRVPLTESEADLFLRLTPLGRKIRFRRLALAAAALPGAEAKAQALLEWSRLPPREWRSP